MSNTDRMNEAASKMIGKSIKWINCEFPDTESVIAAVHVDGLDIHLTLANGTDAVITVDGLEKFERWAEALDV